MASSRWNYDSRGFKPIPTAYSALAVEKRSALLVVYAQAAVASILVPLALAYAREGHVDSGVLRPVMVNLASNMVFQILFMVAAYLL